MTRALHYLPLATCGLCTVLSFGYFITRTCPEVANLFAADHDQFRSGEYWRCVSSLIPHLHDWHFFLDLAYLFIVASLAERMFRAPLMLAFWAMCGLGSNIVFFSKSASGQATIGSSAATHGILMAVVVYIVTINASALERVIALGTAFYLVFISVFAIYFHRMPWPLGDFTNYGYDHLGGIATGLLCGLGFRIRNVLE